MSVPTQVTPPSHDPAALERLLDESRRHYFAELRKADERITARTPVVPEAVMRWALRFASDDLDRFSEGQWSDCRYEIDVLARLEPLEGHRPSQQAMTARKWPNSPDLAEWEAQPSIRYEELQRLPSKAIVRQLHQQVNGFIDALIRRESIEHGFSAPPRERLTFIEGVINGEKTQWPYLSLEMPDLSAIFRHRLFEVFKAYCLALRKCPGCPTRFLADRRNKDYCSSACRNRAYMRVKRNVPPERFGKRGRPRLNVVTPTAPQAEKKKQEKKRAEGTKKKSRQRRRVRAGRKRATAHKGGK